jgi:hypothetical protein
MPHLFHVNVGKEWAFQVDDDSLVASLGGPIGAVGADASAMVRDALAAPLDFPSLASASVPGDRIAVAVDPLLPNAEAAVCGVVDDILYAGGNAELITVVIPESLAKIELMGSLGTRAKGLADVHISIHDPENRAELAYLASTTQGRPVYLNRHLCDADLLIPITCVPPPASPRWLGIHGSVFPAYSDAEARERYRITRDGRSSARRDLECREADEVGWLLGVCVVVGVVPGRNGTVYTAAAGTPPRVCEHCIGAAQGAWHSEMPRGAPLVIALVGSRTGRASWDDFASALASASAAVGEDGAVAICGNFPKRIGRSLRRLVDAADLQTVAARLHGESHEDTWAAQELAAALLRGPVYFAGGMADEQVESLGMAPIGRSEELTRLASRFGECAVIHDAEVAGPRLLDACGVAL